ncbi:DUF6730 family protein [Formosa sp. PL04]|uniref:DUF6730 family protein n=1 Tax=Formosa sp. PL04 TaxID=3081755 RepID=UPI00298233C9|nr:DUF6730 family protein [Formosa sp. PL04]MDW5290927.1 DUF6730 family protein [Formosa sp. PL04]
MTKLEIISELLVEELHEFKNQAQRVEQVSKILNDVRIKADTTEIILILQEFTKKQEQVQTLQKEQHKELLERLRNARVIPNWLLILVTVFFISLAFIIGYLLIIVLKTEGF